MLKRRQPVALVCAQMEAQESQHSAHHFTRELGVDEVEGMGARRVVDESYRQIASHRRGRKAVDRSV